MSVADEIAKLAALRDSGDITQEEFEAAKKQILAGAKPSVAVRSTVPAANTVPKKSALGDSKRRNRGCLISVLVVIVIIVGVVLFHGNSPSATFTVSAYSVVPLDGNTVRVFMLWDNTGKASGSDECVMDTNVHDQFGDLVNTEVNSVGTNGNLKPNAEQRIYQDIGVNNGDAQFIRPGDVTFTGC
jgi:Short C-terminal domain